MMIKSNFISQYFIVTCATCGSNNNVNNEKYDSETFELISDGTFRIERYENSLYLWFKCQHCNNEYRIPFSLDDHTVKSE